ncbi:GNAT family N-acetyltransferase [Endozoicomonas sp. SESOKO1]|uniref:GNAT family N-acetyltransferase n=1 Tax=Endozoicomonas sp. SESOKO1 TaxID=2828742 RepID=UPI0021478787|nr:GNAT family N-acetyltransferase [Endozoicomonas sp. SESOKO1]
MTEPASLSVEELNPIAFPLVNRFFKENGHKGKASGNERVWVARCPKEKIVAGLRASPKSGGYLLRSVQVARDAQRKGIGSFFLRAALNDLNTINCWCYPFAHLEYFYQGAGFFKPEPDSVPPDILDPYLRYRQQGHTFLLMARCPKQA